MWLICWRHLLFVYRMFSSFLQLHLFLIVFFKLFCFYSVCLMFFLNIYIFFSVFLFTLSFMVCFAINYVYFCDQLFSLPLWIIQLMKKQLAKDLPDISKKFSEIRQNVLIKISPHPFSMLFVHGNNLDFYVSWKF